MSESELDSESIPAPAQHRIVSQNTNVNDQSSDTRPISERYLLPILYLLLFLYLYGENIQPAPRTEIYELVICRNLHGDIVLGDSICKSPDVQEELAFLKGTERLLGIFPTFLAIPYSLLADRYGRSFALTLAMFGLFLEETWNLLICWFSSSLPIRLVLLGPFFEFLGGGPAVATTMIFCIAADWVSDKDRTSTFLRMFATEAGAALFAEITGSLLMRVNTWIPWFIGVSILLLATALATILPNWPRDNGASETPILDAVTETTPLMATEFSPKIDDTSSLRERFIDAMKHVQAGVYIIFGNGTLKLLLWTVFLARLGEDSYAMIFLMYISKRFAWNFAKTNIFMAVGDSARFTFLIILLLYLSKTLVTRYDMTLHKRDQCIATISLGMLSVGCLLIGLGPQVWVAAIGVILFASASGLQPILRSLLTSSISPRDITLVYSVVTLLQRVGNALAGPLYSGTYTIGLTLGNPWIGLPFIVAGSLVTLGMVGFLFTMVRKEKHNYEQVPDDDLEA